MKTLDGRDFDKTETKNKEIHNMILELVRSAKRSEKEGNQWKAEFYAQLEHNNQVGEDIIRMTERIEYIKGKLTTLFHPEKLLLISANDFRFTQQFRQLVSRV